MPRQKNKPVVFSKKWAGFIEFKKSLERQESLKETLTQSSIHNKNEDKNLSCNPDNSVKNYFLGFEPSSPVISLGLRSDQTHVLKSDFELKSEGLSIVKVRRGGEGTLHHPGQLVIYPVIQLRSVGLRVKDFIISLQNITQLFLRELGIETKKGEDFAGLYTKKGKIAFFGIHISKGVSQSGLSLNVDNDLSLFQSIKSCGELDRPHDKISNYKGLSLNKKQLFLRWCKLAEKEFS